MVEVSYDEFDDPETILWEGIVWRLVSMGYVRRYLVTPNTVLPHGMIRESEGYSLYKGYCHCGKKLWMKLIYNGLVEEGFHLDYCSEVNEYRKLRQEIRTEIKE